MRVIIKIFEGIFGSSIFKFSYGIRTVILAFFTSFVLVGTALIENFERGENYYTGLFIVLFAFSMFINIIFSEKSDLNWRIRLQQMMRIAFFLNLGLAGILWYLHPDKSHLEPATFLLTVAVAYTSYQIDQNKRKLEHQVEVASMGWRRK